MPGIGREPTIKNEPTMPLLRAGTAVFALVLIFIVGCMDTSGTAQEGPHRPDGFDLQGHRGARGLLPENTIPAFRRALELGVTTLELDVVISADSQVVVSHEPWMSATICMQPDGKPVPAARDTAFNLFEMPYAEIARFDCGSRGHPDFPEQEAMAATKPLLREVVQMAEAYADEHGRTPVFYNVETKARPDWDGTYHPAPESFTELLYAVLEEEGVAARTTIQSFDPRTLQAARAMDPSLSLALLVGSGGGSLEENVAALGFTPTIYSPDYRLVDAALVEAAQAQGMEVIPWTVNAPDDMERLQQLGVDGLITDYPDRARFLIESAG